MANLYENELNITAKESTIKKAKSLILDKDLQVDLSLLVPMPKDVDEKVNWAYTHWGTKWIEEIFGNMHVGEHGTEDGRQHLCIRFNSANGAPTEWFKELCKKFGNADTDIQLIYADPGCMVGGYITNDDDGGIIKDEMVDYEIIDFCGIEEDLDELEDEVE